MNARTISRAVVSTTVPTRRTGNLPPDQLRVVVRAETFAERLRRFRIAAGLSQDTLADQVSIARSSLDAYERGWHVPPVDTFARLLAALGTTFEALWRGEPCQS